MAAVMVLRYEVGTCLEIDGGLGGIGGEGGQELLAGLRFVSYHIIISISSTE